MSPLKGKPPLTGLTTGPRSHGHSPGGGILGISPDSLYRYAAEGTLPGFRLGNRWRFKKTRLDAWMEEQMDEQSSARPRRKPVRSVR